MTILLTPVGEVEIVGLPARFSSGKVLLWKPVILTTAQLWTVMGHVSVMIVQIKKVDGFRVAALSGSQIETIKTALYNKGPASVLLSQ